MGEKEHVPSKEDILDKARDIVKRDEVKRYSKTIELEPNEDFNGKAKEAIYHSPEEKSKLEKGL